MNPILQQVRLIYYALLGGQVLFAGVVYFLLSSGMGGEGAPGDPTFRTLAPLAIFGAAAAAFFLNRQRQAQAATMNSPQARAEHYRATVIVRSALLEGGNLMAVIAALVSQDLSLLLYFAVGVLAFVYFRPSQTEFDRDFGGG